MAPQTFSERLRGVGYEPSHDHGVMLVRSETPFRRGDSYDDRRLILGTFPQGSQVYNAEGGGSFVGVIFTPFAHIQRMLAPPEVRRMHGWPLIDDYSKREGNGYKFVQVSHTHKGMDVSFIHLAPGEEGLHERVKLKGAFDNDGNPVATDPNAKVIEKELFDVEVVRVLDSLGGN